MNVLKIVKIFREKYQIPLDIARIIIKYSSSSIKDIINLNQLLKEEEQIFWLNKINIIDEYFEITFGEFNELIPVRNPYRIYIGFKEYTEKFEHVYQSLIYDFIPIDRIQLNRILGYYPEEFDSPICLCIQCWERFLVKKTEELINELID